MIRARTPWEAFMGDTPMHLDYFQGTMFEAVKKIADKAPDSIAFRFMGRAASYRTLVTETERCARARANTQVRTKRIGKRRTDA